MSKPFDIAGRIQHAQRRQYACPLCDDIFQQEPRLWEHGLQIHKSSLGEIGTPDEAETTRKQFRLDAIAKEAQKKASRRSGADPAQPSPSTRRNARRGIKQGSPTRPSSAPGYNQVSGKKIDDIGSLTLEQSIPKDIQEGPSAAGNPRKRGAAVESLPPEAPVEGRIAGSMTSRFRHGRNSSGDNPNFSRQEYSRQRSVHTRPRSDANKRVWDPLTDDPYANTSRREKDQAYSNRGRGYGASMGFSCTTRDPKSEEIDDVPQGSVHDDPNSLRSDIAYNDTRNLVVNLEGSREPSSDDSQPVEENPEYPEAEPKMLLQPETRPISHEQLVVEVKGIYAGLVMVEAKCIDIDEKQSAAAQEKDKMRKATLKDDQWQSLIALHKQLLHEHHDFFLASQHPSASPALSRLAAKYSMPARMWRHGIHAFLEVLRHRLPESLEHMLAFIYIAYSMMALLYETVSTFEDTWIECLGDLGRYRMAIEDDEPKDREVWSGVARFWYNKASDKSPTVGRLYHHLAILARPYTLEQLSLYTRSLTCVTPFESAKGSILTLFNPILEGKDSHYRKPNSFETIFIKAHGLLFTRKPGESFVPFDETVRQLEDGLLERYICRAAARFKDIGVFAAVSNIAALFEYGAGSKQGLSISFFRQAFEKTRLVKEEASVHSLDTPADPMNLPSPTGPPKTELTSLAVSQESSLVVSHASKLAFMTLRISLKHHDRNVIPLVHVYLVFLWSLLSVETAMEAVEQDVPWTEMCSFLNLLATKHRFSLSKSQSNGFSNPDNDKQDSGAPLAEDFVLRGQMYTQSYFPQHWFTDTMDDDDERTLDPPSMVEPREKRILWLGFQIASSDRWLHYKNDSERFVLADYAEDHLGASIHIATNLIELQSKESSLRSASGVAEGSSRTASLAPSESNYDPKDSTRASTPIDTNSFVPPNEPPGTPKAQETLSGHASIQDVSMMDLSTGKDKQYPFDEKPNARPGWMQEIVIQPSGTPIEKPQSDYASNIIKFREIEHDGNREDNDA